MSSLSLQLPSTLDTSSTPSLNLPPPPSTPILSSTSSGFITSATPTLTSVPTPTETPHSCETRPIPCGGKALGFLGLVVGIPVVAFVLLLISVFYCCRQYKRRKGDENVVEAAAAGQAQSPETYRYTTAARRGYKQPSLPPGYYASVCG